jgi:hypothetical protein
MSIGHLCFHENLSSQVKHRTFSVAVAFLLPTIFSLVAKAYKISKPEVSRKTETKKNETKKKRLDKKEKGGDFLLKKKLAKEVYSFETKEMKWTSY